MQARARAIVSSTECSPQRAVARGASCTSTLALYITVPILNPLRSPLSHIHFPGRANGKGQGDYGLFLRCFQEMGHKHGTRKWGGLEG